ncbi:MAG TPA: hypothetical protein DGG95_04715 [Cytophagales bacterium]|jgi:hypothetical protein|nr:hypothetical protein [Cytophagales bacterium]
MKKSSIVVLTIVAALTLNSCAVQKTASNLGPPDPVYDEQIADTPKPTVRDTTVVYYNNNYYYRSYFWDNMYRIFFPHRYYYVISQPGYVPKHRRLVRNEIATTGGRRPSRSSSNRGGFGHHGSTHSAIG